ncbi:GNAT family N-acetyltransferase [Chengkuizengella axinellae]|uniref:GNAT family N-acetyltransferase n=1 Tax=Chengkuizengella axinellae TaxID=3064388 RepID=A0ABT9IZV8_9BACL|nr:GNAT family N-acetyltransferase [Chengkuizengella sp. 2205SS18-9]MDP5274897.1 GNAT family N-acetyltransferase [Chengkuizengella sp. 2205SS18-9]
MKLYQNAGWWSERNEQDINLVLKSAIYVGAWQNDELVGFARAITDGKFRAYIEDVVVHTDIQREGIGLKLINELMNQLSHIDIVSLFSREDLISFYEENGFKSSKSQIVMHAK